MKTSTLEEICYLVTDGTHDTPKRQSEGVPLIKAKEIVGGKIDFDNCDLISYEDHLKVIARSKPEEGDTLFAHIGASLGETAFIRTNREFSIKNVALFKPNSKIVNKRYFYYCIISPRFQSLIKNIRTGSAQPFIGLNSLRHFNIEIHHDITVQTKIASILSAYDDLIENNLKRIKILEEMAQTIYREWFVNFRFPGHEKVKMVKSELGMIPEGWDGCSIEDLYDTSSGGTPSRIIEEYYSGGNINWIKTKELNDGFLFQSEEMITELGLNKSSAKIFPRNTVIIAMYGATIGKLGILSEEASSNQACCALLEKNEYFKYPYIFHFLLQHRNDIIGMRLGAAQQNISQQIIKKIKILKPSQHIIANYNESILPTMELCRILQKKNATLQHTRDLLLPKLISGEIDVEDFNINTENLN